MEVNYFGHIAVTNAFLDYIPEDGAIVYISSVQGRIAVPFRSAYSASKHAAQVYFPLKFSLLEVVFLRLFFKCTFF